MMHGRRDIKLRMCLHFVIYLRTLIACQMIVGFVSYEWEITSLESVMTRFKRQFCHLRGNTEENRKMYSTFRVRNGHWISE